MKMKNIYTGFLLLSVSTFLGGQDLNAYRAPKVNANKWSAKRVNTVGKTSSTRNYSFSQRTATYNHLTQSTSVNNNQIWDDPEYVVPIGFNFELYNLTIDSLYFGIGTGGLVSSKYDTGFIADYLIAPFDADLVDRGYFDGVSKSPISYRLEGRPGGRIFKLEWKNVGFYYQGDVSPLVDSISFQLWLYEGSNTIEVHFGDSRILSPSLNYFGETGAFIGLSDYFEFDVYALAGAASNPSLVDSFTYIDGTPATGTVYRFTKNSIGLEELSQANALQIYPNPVKEIATLTFGRMVKDARLEVYDLQGRMLKGVTGLNYAAFEIDCADLVPGVYQVRLLEGQQVLGSARILIER